MRGVLRKALSDMRGRPLQSGLMFIVIAAAAATLSLALNVHASASEPYERLREQTNAADAWISAFAPGTDLSRLEGLPGVVAVGEPYPVSWENYGIRNGERKQQIALVGMGEDLPDFDHPAVTRGRWLSAGGANEMVVDYGAARLLKLRVGQEVDLQTEEGPRRFTVVGFAVTASRNPAPYSDPAFAYVLPETLRQIEPDVTFGAEGRYTLRVGVRMADPTNPGSLFFGARELGGRTDIELAASVRETSKEVNEFDIIFLNVFSVFALLAAGLIIANAVGGQVLSQLHDIGILKTVGFTPRQVTLTLLLQNLTLALAASLLGVLLGLLAAPYFLRKTADLFGVPAGASLDPTLLAIAIVVVIVLVTVFTIVPAWRAGRIRAMAALDAGNTLFSSGRSRVAALAARLGLPSVVVVGVKDIGRRPSRTAMTVLALVLAVVTATFSLGIEATFNKTMSEPTVIGGPPYDIASDRDTFPDAEARRIFDANPDVTGYLPVLHTGARPATGNIGFDVQAFEGNLQEPRWRLREGRMPSTRGEAAVTTEFVREYGIDVGDRMTVIFAGEASAPTEIQVVGRFVSVEGSILAVTRDTVPGDEPPTDYLVGIRDGAEPRAVANALIEASGGYLDPEVFDETIGDIRDDFRSVLVMLNAVLFTIAGLNLLSSLLLNIRERRRDFAILKTVGFTPGQVAQSVFSGSTALALIAVAVGLPLGLVATRVMFDLLSSAAGIGTGVGAMPGVLWLAPLVPGAIAVAGLATVLPARQAASVAVAEVLRYE